jgi:amidohydrolase
MNKFALINLDEMIIWRRHFHMYPELSGSEKETASYIARLLNDFGLEIEIYTGGCGVAGRLKTNRPGPGIAFRADIDALPVMDEKNVSYRSKVDGVCHACGHDGHTAILLGAAKALSQMRSKLNGEITFIFQPSEEMLPGGALEMIQGGCLKGIDKIFGLHVNNSMNVGQISTTAGPMMASSDFFNLEIRGRGGHGAIPETTIDSIVISAQIINQFQAIISRMISPLEPSVLTVGSIHGGATNNVIADKVKLKGTVRCFNNETAEKIKKNMRALLDGTCKAYGSEYDLDFEIGFPPLTNSETETKELIQAAKKVIPETEILIQNKVMLGEDFGRYLEHVPGCYFFVGSKNSAADFYFSNHHPQFDIDEKALEIGAEIFVQLALDYCLME